MEKVDINFTEKETGGDLKNPEKIEEFISREEIEEIIKGIKNTYNNAIEKFLEDEDPLKEKILDYFVNRESVDAEYLHILSNLSNEDKRAYVKSLEDYLSNPSNFLSRMERFFSVQEIYKKQKELKEKPRIATPEEYEIGVFSDLLEDQVRDAVFVLNKKGYKTFQSGYSETNYRNQFVDVYNSKIEIPKNIREDLLKIGVKILVEKLDDRTTITLSPVDPNKIIRQDEWREIWDYFSNKMPEANSELVNNIKEPTDHLEFRRIQDIIRDL